MWRERTNGQWKRRFHCLHSEIRLLPNITCRVIISCGVLHHVVKANNIPLNDDEEDDMKEVDNRVAGNGFALRKTVTVLHFSV